MKKTLIKILIVLVAVVIIAGSLSGFIVDIQWFKEVGYLNVFLTSFKAKIIIFIPAFIILSIIVNLYIRYLRRAYFRLSNRVYMKKELKTQNAVILGASLVVSLLLSMIFTGGFWYKILEFFNATNFNVKDPIFNYDAGFYIFKLPLIQSVLGVLITVVVLMIIVTLLFYGMLRVMDGAADLRGFVRGQDSPELRFVARQLSIFGAVLLLLLAGVFYLNQLNLVYSPRGVAYGASYTDMHVTLPMYRIISIMCIIAAVIVAFAIIRKKVKWIVVTAGFIIALMVLQVAASGLVEQFIVSPNAREKEIPYLTYNIDFTRKAFGLDSISEKQFNVDNNITAKELTDNSATIDNIRINEFSQSLEVYNQVQAIRNYYKFNDVDIDRYNINGNIRQVFLAARELDNSNMEAKFQTWQNKHLFYTHGYGAVMSYTNTVNESGLPDYILKDIPPTGNAVKLDKPQIYFGELNDDYIIVGAKSNEIDYPTENANAETRYNGTAGIKLSFLNRLLFTVNYGSLNFLLSNDITPDSKIILNRAILSRVTKIAPFLNYDQDPYLVASGGKLYWIIDAYTTTDKYPYSEPYNGINYIRNSVKVVVDAYNGSVNFYLSDPTDAMAQTIGKIYGGLFKNLDEMPQDLRSHLRYSEDVFMAQSKVYEKYHMNDPVVFYNNEDLWSIAKYKNSDGSDVSVQPVYQVMKLPGQNKEELVLTIPFTVANKENMVSWLAVQMNPDNLGKMMLVEFQKDKAIYGPQQFNSKINTNTQISQQLSLWDQKGSQVILGETNIIPINNTLIYVKPMYLRADSEKSLPELKKVIVGIGDNIVMADNIQQAFASLFNVDVTQQPDTTAPSDNTPGAQQDTVKSLVIQASDLYDKAQQAQKNGDWAAYGDYLKQLSDTLAKLKGLTQ